VHGTGFSTIVGTTRSRELDGYMKGHSLGTMGHKVKAMKEGKEVKLMFGECVESGSKSKEARGSERPAGESMDGNGNLRDQDSEMGNGTVKRIGFASAENVIMLRKGVRYV